MFMVLEEGDTKLSKVKCDGLNLLEVECKTPAENGGSGRVK